MNLIDFSASSDGVLSDIKKEAISSTSVVLDSVFHAVLLATINLRCG
eukprot:CAMPEP_0194139476 /NCGR_PEP_ID=MMETSP0152-20130528/9114_1 /TAXON_ID=1049557 /ORGANISM="Thalassiothrix antarctica, Strain L6-D1" /LENGTH=46 /DNA_ID= /DNA_START= /DNA_END= /DNA_ORIENTATION=